mmetsp:Transcript_12681/g.18993  ORF Transcript_12681/g.18993 Transcript_12681/m.18993 type:complete len:276 (+) Transcript_12681:107-934(+)
MDYYTALGSGDEVGYRRPSLLHIFSIVVSIVVSCAVFAAAFVALSHRELEMNVRGHRHALSSTRQLGVFNGRESLAVLKPIQEKRCIGDILTTSAKKKEKAWGKLRHNTRTSIKWIPKMEDMSFQVIGDREKYAPEDVLLFIRDWFEKYPESEVHIGADSKKRGASTSYVIGICLYHRGHGGTVLYHRKVVPTFGSDLERLWVELELAMEVSQFVRDDLGHDQEIHVHIDYNPKPMYRVSNALYASGMAWIKSSGFTGVAKPDAWAASSVADKLT